MNADDPSSREEIGGHLRDLHTGAAVGFALKAIAFGGTLLLSLVATRSLGADQAGLFFLALTIVTVLSTVARAGLDKPLVRHVASAQAQRDGDGLRELVSSGLLVVAALSLLFAAAEFLARTWLASTVFNKPELRFYLDTMSWAIPALAVSGYVGLAFQGISRIAPHLLFYSALTPFMAVAAYATTPLGLGGSFTAGAAVTAALALAAWQRSAQWSPRLLGWERMSPILASSRATLVVIVLQLLMTWVPTVLLGVMAQSRDVAAYHVSVRVALLIGFVLVAVNGISAPKFASLHATGQLRALEETVIRTTRLATWAALPIAAVFLAWPEWIMALFGGGFDSAGPLLRVLALGYLVNTSTGSVANLLLMTGHERSYRNICLAGAAVNAAVTAAAVWRFGAIGAAWGTTASLVVVSFGAAVVARRRLGFSGIARSSRAGIG